MEIKEQMQAHTCMTQKTEDKYKDIDYCTTLIQNSKFHLKRYNSHFTKTLEINSSFFPLGIFFNSVISLKIGLKRKNNLTEDLQQTQPIQSL